MGFFAVDMNCLTEGLPENLPPPSEWYFFFAKYLCYFFYLKNEFSWFLFFLQVMVDVSFLVYRLEDTLIELYLSGYSNKTIDDASDTRGEDVNTPADGL